MLTEDEAIERARERLTRAKAPHENREVKVIKIDNNYKVSFPPPPGRRAGSFVVVLDAETGKVLETIIGR